MKLTIPDKELKEEFRKYIMRKIKREFREEIEEQILNLKSEDMVLEIDHRKEDYDRKLEKIIDWIKERDRDFII